MRRTCAQPTATRISRITVTTITASVFRVPCLAGIRRVVLFRQDTSGARQGAKSIAIPCWAEVRLPDGSPFGQMKNGFGGSSWPQGSNAPPDCFVTLPVVVSKPRTTCTSRGSCLLFVFLLVVSKPVHRWHGASGVFLILAPTDPVSVEPRFGNYKRAPLTNAPGPLRLHTDGARVWKLEKPGSCTNPGHWPTQ